jgi:hypothetical protein
MVRAGNHYKIKEVIMGKIVSYIHHDVRVAVDETLKGKHRDHCLCFRCASFFPNEPGNCDLAEQNYRACKINNMVMPVYECPCFILK